VKLVKAITTTGSTNIQYFFDIMTSNRYLEATGRCESRTSHRRHMDFQLSGINFPVMIDDLLVKFSSLIPPDQRRSNAFKLRVHGELMVVAESSWISF